MCGPPCVDAVTPAPITRRPKYTNGRRLHPSAWNPEVAVRATCPIAGGPQIARCRYRWLLVNWQLRWRTNVADANDLCLRGDRNCRNNQREQKPSSRAREPHVDPPVCPPWRKHGGRHLDTRVLPNIRWMVHS